MKTRSLLLAVFALFSLSFTANAGILIEPYIGYEQGSADNGTEEDDIKGLGFGARLGYRTMGFMFGAQYDQSTTADTEGVSELAYTNTDLGIFVGYEAPIAIRFWATYLVDSTSKLAVDSGVTVLDDAEVTGDGGLRFAVGFTGLPFVSVNLEYISRKYDKLKVPGFAEQDFDGDNAETYMLSLSLPLP